MTQSTLRTIWITASLLLFLFAFNMYNGTQKSDFSLIVELPIEFKAADNLSPVKYALYGLRGIALVFWVIPFLGWIHAKAEGGSAAAAFPFRLLDIVPDTKPGRVVQVLAVSLLIVAPFLAAFHFWEKIGTDGRVCTDDRSQACVGVWDVPVRWSGWWDHTYRFSDGSARDGSADGVSADDSSPHDGPTYEPIVEPVLAVVLLAVALAFTGLLAVEMYRASKRPSKQKGTPEAAPTPT